MKTIYLGIDNGNFNTKSSDHILYPSGFAMQNKPFITPDRQLSYGGKFYAIGDSRMSLQQEKAKEEDTFLLSLPLMAHAMKLEGVHEAEFILGVGLPFDVFGAQKKAFHDYFMRDRIDFGYEREKYSAVIRSCKVYPQGYAALCKNFDKFKDMQSVTIVDIGGYTVDVVTVENNVPIRSSCMSLHKGTITLINGIRSALQQQNIVLSDALIVDAINERSQHKEAKQIIAIAAEQVSAYIKDLLNALREHGLDLNLPIAFAGGGAELLEKQLTSSDANVIAVLDRFANADGYKALLKA